MAVFDAKSRYARYAKVYQTTDARGRPVAAVSAPDLPTRPTLGDHLLKEHQRLDHLAGHYLANPNGFWSLAHHAGRILPDAVLAAPTVSIPREG
jgi:hypothetical protein